MVSDIGSGHDLFQENIPVTMSGIQAEYRTAYLPNRRRQFSSPLMKQVRAKLKQKYQHFKLGWKMSFLLFPINCEFGINGVLSFCLRNLWQLDVAHTIMAAGRLLRQPNFQTMQCHEQPSKNIHDVTSRIYLESSFNLYNVKMTAVHTALLSKQSII